MRKIHLGRPPPGGAEAWTKKTFKEIEDASHVPDPEIVKTEARLRYSLPNLKRLFLRFVYPVKCIFITTDPTNPHLVFGFGTWVAFGAGKVPVGFLNADPDFGTVEATGGEKTHALTAAENGPHQHNAAASNSASNTTTGGAATRVTAIGAGSDFLTGSSGSGTPHNNLQPFIVVYMWKRAA